MVVEKATYPREKICAGGVGARAFRILEALGVEVDVPRVPIDAMLLRLSTGREAAVRVPGMGAVVRRVQFDHALARAARARGIEVREGCEVESIAIDRHVTLHTTTGAIEARCAVGADGVAGVMRRALGFGRGDLRAQVIELDTPATPHDAPRDTIVFDFATRDLAGYAWDFPTLVAGAPLVCRGVYVLHDKQRHALDDTRARTEAYLAARGLRIADYKLKRFAERGLEPGLAIARPRALLVGEAAGIDIATGEGIAQAIEYGMLAGPYLAAALAKDDFGFADWRQTIERRHLGKQFRIRHACYRAFYGSKRDTLERAIPRIGHLMKVGVQDFAGVPISKWDLAVGGAQFVGSIARDFLT